jgi:hypothetical protein
VLLDPWKMGQICCSETSVTNYKPTSHNIAEKRRLQLSAVDHDSFLSPHCYYDIFIRR